MGEVQPAEAADNSQKDSTHGGDRVSEEIAQVGRSLWAGWQCVCLRFADQQSINRALRLVYTICMNFLWEISSPELSFHFLHISIERQ